MKTFRLIFPEIYFIVATLYYWSLTAVLFNWIAFVLILLLGILIVTKNRYLGILISSLVGVVNLYLVLALFSELSEFNTFNLEAKKLLIVGLLFLGLNIFFSVRMLKKYLSIKKQKALANS
ncbi:hypothetical protein [Hanstruepera flava]|uniref:hypothetical protein n=1 Tax=Hanstruepera flava TaxID=2930218 RepID=UPI002027813F|nr:hypothetical protein [Hanstruepera flava]